MQIPKDDLIMAHLLANPSHVKRNQLPLMTIEDEIISLLQRKFKNISNEKEDYIQLIVKIENVLIETIIENKINQIIQEIVHNE